MLIEALYETSWVLVVRHLQSYNDTWANCHPANYRAWVTLWVFLHCSLHLMSACH
eukprot:m.1197020 g.1197020  ORF g.1197020 m.1197020 type:complete len:55 (+) comp24565_c0_seq1:1513-1677(+)